MADRRFLGAMAGLAQGVEKASANLVNIMKASYDIKQNQELIGLKKKALEADISQAGWQKDYQSGMLDLQTKKLAVDKKTAILAGEKTRMEIDKYKEVAKNLEFIRGKIFGGQGGQQNTPADGMDMKDLGWSYSSGTGDFTVRKPTGRETLTEQWRNDLIIARDSVKNGEMSPDEAISILEDTYADKFTDPTKRMELKMAWEGLVPKGGKARQSQAQPITQPLSPEPNRQAQIDKARQAGYTDEEINAYLKGQ